MNGNPVYVNTNITVPPSESKDWPYAVQFGYILYDNHTHNMKVVNEFIRLPDGVVITEGSEKIHGISITKTQGKTKKIVNPFTNNIEMVNNPEIGTVLCEFMKDFRKADKIVAHNLRFDRNIILAEMDRIRKIQNENGGIGLDDIDEDFNVLIKEFYENKKQYCTCFRGINFCKIPAINAHGNIYYKMPKLTELYTCLFGKVLDSTKMHDALSDVIVCMRCFYKMRYNVYYFSIENNVKPLCPRTSHIRKSDS